MKTSYDNSHGFAGFLAFLLGASFVLISAYWNLVPGLWMPTARYLAILVGYLVAIVVVVLGSIL